MEGTIVQYHDISRRRYRLFLLLLSIIWFSLHGSVVQQSNRTRDMRYVSFQEREGFTYGRENEIWWMMHEERKKQLRITWSKNSFFPNQTIQKFLITNW